MDKWIITYQEPIEGIKVWLLLGYPSKFWNYTPKKQFGWFPHSPRPSFNFHRKLIFFVMLVRMSSIRFNNNWNYTKTTYYHRTVPLSVLELYIPYHLTYFIPWVAVLVKSYLISDGYEVGFSADHTLICGTNLYYASGSQENYIVMGGGQHQVYWCLFYLLSLDAIVCWWLELTVTSFTTN